MLKLDVSLHWDDDWLCLRGSNFAVPFKFIYIEAFYHDLENCCFCCVSWVPQSSYNSHTLWRQSLVYYSLCSLPMHVTSCFIIIIGYYIMDYPLFHCKLYILLATSESWFHPSNLAISLFVKCNERISNCSKFEWYSRVIIHILLVLAFQ